MVLVLIWAHTHGAVSSPPWTSVSSFAELGQVDSELPEPCGGTLEQSTSLHACPSVVSHRSESPGALKMTLSTTS